MRTSWHYIGDMACLCLMLAALAFCGSCDRELSYDAPRYSQLRSCGIPVKGGYFGNSESILAYSPLTGLEVLYLSYYADEGCEILGVDWRSGDLVTAVKIPSLGGYGAVVGTDGCVYIGGVEPGDLYRYHPWENRVEVIPVHELGVQYLWRLALGGNGRVYGAGDPNAQLVEYDPSTGALAGFGPLSETATVVRSVAVDGQGLVWCGLGWPSEIVVVDPQDGSETRILKEALGSSSFVYDLWSTGHLVFCAIAYDGPLLVIDSDSMEVRARVPPPLGQRYWRIVRNGSSSNEVFLFGRPDGGLYRFKPSTGDLVLLLPNVWNVCAVVQNRYVLEIDDGALVVHDLEAEEILSRKTLENARRGMGICSLVSSKDGVLYGSVSINNHLWRDDTTGGLTDLGGVLMGGGQVDSICIGASGSLYLGAYPYARLLIYDPARPWDPGPADECNPRLVATVGSGQFRILSITEVESGLTFMGTAPAYGTASHGTLSCYDPEIGSVKTWDNVVPGGTVICLDTDGKLVLGCGGGMVFAWDPCSETLVSATSVEGVKEVVHAGSSQVFAASADSVCLIDYVEGSILSVLHIPEGVVTDLCRSPLGGMFVLTEEETYWVPDDCSQMVRVLDGGGLHITSSPDGDLYLAQEAVLAAADRR